jgi:phosphatidylglycerophosphate synthase
MSGVPPETQDGWETKPTDRFILKWIKLNLSARITTRLLTYRWLRPWMITLLAAALGTFAGAVFALGAGWLAGCIAAVAQVLDGVDGQFARLTQRQSPGGALWDSVLDRYADGALMIGMVVYLARPPAAMPLGLLLSVGTLAVVSSSLVSYTTARGAALGLNMGRPTLASKGTRWTVMILCAWGSPIWHPLPALGLWYLALHPSLVVASRLWQARGV